MKKWVGIGLAIILVIGLGFFGWSKFIKQKSSTVSKPLTQKDIRSNMIMTVKKDSLEKMISVSGTVEPVESQDLYFKTNGTVKSINIEEGARVEKGQVLMEIENDEQRLNYIKAKNSYETIVISGTESKIKEAELNLKIAKDRLDETKLKAPFAGIINEISIEEGSYTAQDQDKTVAKLIDNSGYQVEVSVDESDSRQLELGQPARITMEALPNQELKGEVVDIGANAEVNSGVVTLPVMVAIKEKPKFIKPGFSAEVEIIVEQIKEQLILPITAVYNEKGETKAVKIVKGKPTPVNVKIGVSSGRNVVIKEGLQAGDKILINTYMFANGAQNLQQGDGGPRMMRGGGH
ncbi:MAG: RND family efflux transporter, MFP subunit [Candidatus Frackibacter sp. T328-2]|nr:MAG: RND family efflux transporter, MFP subunit [Candidatus Frackibacter sp. T328-2]